MKVYSMSRRRISFVWAFVVVLTTSWIFFQAAPLHLMIYMHSDFVDYNHEAPLLIDNSSRKMGDGVFHTRRVVTIENLNDRIETNIQEQLQGNPTDRSNSHDNNSTASRLRQQIQATQQKKMDMGTFDKAAFLRSFAGRKRQNLIKGGPRPFVPISTYKPPKILLFITTIFSEYHVNMFSCCWPKLMEHSKLLPKLHVMIFSNNETVVPQEHLQSAQQLFAENPSFQIRYPPQNELDAIQNLSKEWNQFQTGANLGPKLAFQNGWFDDYDWVIRINPDVLIRNSTWLHDKMYYNPLVEAILVQCHPHKIHTDFFAIRPKALLRYYQDKKDLPFAKLALEPWHKPYPLNRTLLLNHEATTYKSFLPILKKGRHRLLPDADESNGRCRVRGEKSSVYHGHESCNGTSVCDALVGWHIT